MGMNSNFTEYDEVDGHTSSNWILKLEQFQVNAIYSDLAKSR